MFSFCWRDGILGFFPPRPPLEQMGFQSDKKMYQVLLTSLIGHNIFRRVVRKDNYFHAIFSYVLQLVLYHYWVIICLLVFFLLGKHQLGLDISFVCRLLLEIPVTRIWSQSCTIQRIPCILSFLYIFTSPRSMTPKSIHILKRRYLHVTLAIVKYSQGFKI